MGRAFEYRKARKLKRWGNMARTFTKLGKEIAIAVKAAGPDPAGNTRLRVLIQNAKAANMPKENVERAIKRATSKEMGDYKEMVYEGYAPFGIAMVIETATENTTRTVANVRSYFNKAGGSLGTTGSVDFLFDHKCVFKMTKQDGIDLDELELELIDCGVDEVFADGEEIVKTRKINPGIHIPEEATAIHGITDEDVKDCPTFAQIARSLEQFIAGCDFGGFNSNRFDLPMLVEEFMRAGISVDFKRRRFVDVQNIFHKMEQRTLVAAYKFYCDKDLTNAHSAEADTLATYEVLKAQLDRYDNLENDIDFLAEFSTRNESADYAGRILYNEKGEEVFGFGKYKGRCVAEIFESEPSYYNWMMNGDFPLYTKKVITEIRLRGSKEKKR